MDRPKGSSSSSSNGGSHHRAAILSRSRTSKKINITSQNPNSSSSSNLKRSKSLHCPKATRSTSSISALITRKPFDNSSFNALMNNSGGGDGNGNVYLQQKYHPHPLLRSGTQGELPQAQQQQQKCYGSRRHHSTNDYEQMMNLPSNSDSSSNFVLNTSSHSLYRLYNSPSATSVGVGSSSPGNYHHQHHPQNHQLYQPRASCASSGASLASLQSSENYHQQKTLHNGSRKASADCFYEDSVFVEPLSSSPAATAAVATDHLRLLSQQMNSLAIFNGSDHNTLANEDLSTTNGSSSTITNNPTPIITPNRRYNGSSSSSSLINGQPDYSSFLDHQQYEGGGGGLDDQDDQSFFDYDYFNLEPLPLITTSNETSKLVSTPSGTASARPAAKKFNSRASVFRFYLVRQRNYPPLFLENSGARRRIYRTLVLGYPSSGKSSLLEQFASWLAESESTRSFHPAMASDLAEPTNLLVHFLESDSFDKYLLQVPVIDYQPDAYLILFSVNNRDSFNSVKKTLVDLQRWDDVETKAVIIVANKSDLVRGRCVTRREGRELASANNCKYIEVSCTISHNIDVLLQGLGSQMVLKEEQQRKQKELEQNKVAKHNSPLKRRDSLLKRFLRKTAINKSKSCDNLHVL